MSIFELILAIIFPPLAVGLRYGFSKKLFISIILTIVGFIPGIVHAIVVLR